MENILIINVPAAYNKDNSSISMRVETRFRPGMVPQNMIENLKLSNERYSPKIGDKLFFLPGVNIPRVKLKQLVLDYNITIVKNLKEANAVFGSRHSLSKMVKSEWYYTIPVENFKECFTLLEPYLDNKDIATINLALDTYPANTIYSDWASLYNFCDEELFPYKNQIVNVGAAAQLQRKSTYVEVADEQYIDLIKDLQNVTIFNEADLIAELNGDDAILITEEVFEQLSEMFKSSDTDNHVIAMEIMANSRYKESLLFIHLLFKQFHTQMRSLKSRDHVNFKSLLSYLHKESSYMHSTLDDTVKSMKDKGVLTTEALDYLLNKFHYEILQSGDTTVFKVKSITVSEEILANINSNYVFPICPDFIPKIVEVVEEVVEIKPENLQWL